MPPIDKMDTHYLSLAKENSEYSIENKKVGAVIIAGEYTYNGFNHLCAGIGEQHPLTQNIKLRKDLIIHAEMHALIKAVEQPAVLPSDTTLYIYGLPMCINCAKHILYSGIERVVYQVAYELSEEWLEQEKIVKTLFNKVRATYERY